jgi:hypothetical protein
MVHRTCVAGFEALLNNETAEGNAMLAESSEPFMQRGQKHAP